MVYKAKYEEKISTLGKVGIVKWQVPEFDKILYKKCVENIKKFLDKKFILTYRVTHKEKEGYSEVKVYRLEDFVATLSVVHTQNEDVHSYGGYLEIILISNENPVTPLTNRILELSPMLVRKFAD